MPPFVPQLAQRRLVPELMDDPALDAARHVEALRGLERINRWSRSAAILWPSLGSLAQDARGRPLRVLDVACGAGDVPIALWRRTRRAGLTMQIDACDVSERALEHDHRRAAEAGAAVRFFRRDALAQPLPEGYDAIASSLFLHHLTDAQAVAFLRAAAAAAQSVLVNDLRRSIAALAVATVGTRLLSRSPVVHFDGPQSVRAALTLPEARALAERAGLAGAEVRPRWPWRFLLEWRRA